MPIVAHSHPFVVGVDTHARKHVYALIDTVTGALLETNDFSTSATGINRAIAWVSRRTDAVANTLWVIEGAATYCAILAGVIAARKFPVVEAPFMEKRLKGAGKSDVLDAHRMATAVLGLQEEKLRRPRTNEGIRQSLRILLSARESMPRMVTDEEFLLSDPDTGEVVMSFPLPLTSLYRISKFIPSYAIRGIQMLNASTQWESKAEHYRKEYEQRSTQMPDVFTGDLPRSSTVHQLSYGRRRAGGTCTQSHEIGCPRSDEIRCPRCTEITRQVVRTEVPFEAI
ncbi:IS110 family transposase [Glutamicibacter ardleyensis]|uniref:IS110 family transposase n=1 Tax=Glutamicibacter ardleyensis TaxID=225894 RepID=UPI003FD64534